MRTTINIKNELLKKLKNCSRKLGISTHELVAILINTFIKKEKYNIILFKPVKYQKRSPLKKWEKLHVTFKPQIYEKGLDLRNFSKLSVSFIISFAIIHYLDEVIEELMNPENKRLKLDNYPLNYTLIANSYNGIQGFLVFWGIPGEKELKILIQ